MAWTEEEFEAVREAIKKQEELVRPKILGLERLMEILKGKEGKDGEN